MFSLAGRWVALGGCVPLGVWNAAACVVRPHLCGTIHEAGVRPAPELASSIPVRAGGGGRRSEPGAVEASAGRGRGPGGAGWCVHERPEWAGSALLVRSVHSGPPPRSQAGVVNCCLILSANLCGARACHRYEHIPLCAAKGSVRCSARAPTGAAAFPRWARWIVGRAHRHTVSTDGPSPTAIKPYKFVNATVSITTQAVSITRLSDQTYKAAAPVPDRIRLVDARPALGYRAEAPSAPGVLVCPP